ncbi:MAG: hypothetical protein HZC47_02175 [Methanobacterium sp.]|uniref:PsbP-related protein n=1 Tax=Methanobacterium sp. TaxID=2164 RepID=UPI003D6547FE|nr:hypothetical protein [Methanobacterium sp.]
MPLRKESNKREVRLKDPLRRDNSKKSKKGPLDIPHRKEILAIAIAVLIALLIIIITSSSTPFQPQGNNTSNQGNLTIPTKIYAAGGISLEYPALWNVTADAIIGSNMQIMIQDPGSTNNPNATQIAAFNLIKVQKDPAKTLEQRKDEFIQSFKDSGANIAPVSSTNTTINGINATETIYDGNDPKYQKIHLRIVYFEQNNIFYIMAFFTKGLDLESQKPYFDIIQNSFKVQ